MNPNDIDVEGIIPKLMEISEALNNGCISLTHKEEWALSKDMENIKQRLNSVIRMLDMHLTEQKISKY